MFPGADMTHPDLKHAFRLVALEHGAVAGRRRRTCRRGHAIRGSNVELGSRGQRLCGRCRRAWSALRRRRITEASGTKPCGCGCGTEIPNRPGRQAPLDGPRAPQGRPADAPGLTKAEKHRESRRRRLEASGTRRCECGCGTEIPGIGDNGELRRFAHGHERRRRVE
jgi:hypothetical protein